MAQAEKPKREEEQRRNDEKQSEEDLARGHVPELQQLHSAQELLLLLTEEAATESCMTGNMGANAMNEVRNPFF